MAVHDVLFSIPEQPLGKVDTTYQVKRDGEVFGTLHISKGALVWYPKGNSYGHKMTWLQFHTQAVNFPRKEKR